MQEYSSKMTSINTARLPAVWKMLNLEHVARFKYPGPISIVDYGCGRAATVNQVKLFLMNNNVTEVTYWPYDPYWGNIDENRNAISCLCQWKTADLCVCANVLNVINDASIIESIILDVVNARNWVFQIYEGDGSGTGRCTKTDCWQNNMKTIEYFAIIKELVKGPCYVKGNIITNNLNLLK